MGGSTDYGLTPEELMARESLLSYFVDLIKRLGPLRLDGPELRCHLQDRLEDSDSLLVGRGAESLFQTDNFGAFLARSSDLIWVDDYVCAKIDEDKAKDMALADIITSRKNQLMLTTPAKVISDLSSTNTLPTSAINPYGAIGASSPASMSSLPATNMWKSGPPSIIGKFTNKFSFESQKTLKLPIISTNMTYSLHSLGSSTGVHSGAVNSQTTCSPDVMVLGNVDSLYEAAVRTSDQAKSPGQVSSGHPVFPVSLPDLTSPPPPLPSPSKMNTAVAPLSAAVGSNRPIAAVAAMNNNAADTSYKTTVGSTESSRTNSVPAATVESLNKRMQGLSLCNADLLRQLADKDKQLQTLVKTLTARDQELEAAKREITKLKEQKVIENFSSKVDDSENSTEQLKRTTSLNSNEITTTSTENQLIISLQKQLESEKLNSRNLKQQLDQERLYATRISEKQDFLYNKVNQNTSGNKPTVGNSSSLLGAVPQNKIDNTLTSNFGSISDSFGLRGLLSNTATQQHSSTDIFDGLLGSDDIFKALTNHSTNNVSINPPPVSTPSPVPSSLRPTNGRHTNNTILNSAINPQASSTGFSALPQHSFSRSEHLTGGLNRSNSTGTPTSGNRHNLYNVPSSANNLDHNSVSNTVGTIGGSGLSLFGLNDTNSLLRSNSVADATSTETSSGIYSSVIGAKTPSQNSTGSNEDMYTKMANLRYHLSSPNNGYFTI